ELGLLNNVDNFHKQFHLGHISNVLSNKCKKYEWSDYLTKNEYTKLVNGYDSDKLTYILEEIEKQENYLNNNTLLIANERISIKEYRGQRVVTSWDIAKVHKREPREINQNFNYIKNRLILNEDYYLISKEKLAESKILIQEFIPNNVKEIPLFTEQGYLILTKTFNDDLSWEVQRLLVKSYFKLKEIAESQSKFKLPTTYAEALRELATVVEEKEKLEIENREMKPKVEFADTFLLNAKTDISMGEFAKLTEKEFGIGRNTIFSLLRSLKILMSNNLPYQQYMKYFTITEGIKNGKDYLTTLIKVEGQAYLLKRLKKELSK
ncbi:MAG: ORF6N domain-containing protein, partial [Parvimonas sp.]|nr:ORF6N domain-containing protein [Parvimonas sp.]